METIGKDQEVSIEGHLGGPGRPKTLNSNSGIRLVR